MRAIWPNSSLETACLSAWSSGGDGFTVIKVFGAASATFSARVIFKALTDKYGGKGGGSDRMCQGRIAGLPTAEELEALLG